ncbi:MAG: DUF5103 domain-containing protein [Rubricoccaceae bacterium]
MQSGAPALRVVDDAVRTIQLYESSQEVSLPVITLGSGETLTLAFDRLSDEGPEAVEVTFRHTDREGNSDLLPTEYLTGFDRDDILDYRESGNTAIPYVHYRYTFPNSQIGFRLSGNYELTATRSRTGDVLFTIPFFVVEQSAAVQLAFGTTLLDGAVGNAIQPAARLAPGSRLSQYDAFEYTVCFVRNGRLDDLRCAPEPRLVDLAQYQFYLPRSQAFGPPPPLYEIDLGGLQMSTEIIDVDRSARPPTALLDLDNAAFGGEVRDAVLATTPLIEGAYTDPGVASTDAEYVETTFRFVPPAERQAAGPVRLVGTFSGWQTEIELAWNPDHRRYDGTTLLKQGLYVYGYTLPGRAQRRILSVGQPSLFTAFVYLRDNQLFTDRLVAIESGIAR